MIKVPSAIRYGLAGAPKPLQNCGVVIFQVFPGHEFCQLDPTVITRDFDAYGQEEIFRRELMSRLMSVHVENSVQHFG